MHNITLTPLLREEIIATLKNYEGMAHLRRRLLEGDLGQLLPGGCGRNLMVQG
jgi:hypothetical protein